MTYRLVAELVTSDRFPLTDSAAEMRQQQIVFVAEERGARARASTCNPVLLEKDSVETLLCQLVTGERACDAAADHGDVAIDVFLESGICRGFTVVDGPIRFSGDELDRRGGKDFRQAEVFNVE